MNFSSNSICTQDLIETVLKARLTLLKMYAKLTPQMLLLDPQIFHFTNYDPNEQILSF